MPTATQIDEMREEVDNLLAQFKPESGATRRNIR